MTTRRYGFINGQPAEVSPADLHYDIGTAYAHLSTVDALGRPRLLIVRDGFGVQKWPWDDYDGASMAVLAAEQVAQRLASEFPGYHRLNDTVAAARRALRSLDPDDVHAANRAGQQLTNVICKASRTRQLPDQTVRLLFGIAGAARATDWIFHGPRTYHYVCNAIDAAAEVDEYFPFRLALWLDTHLRTREWLGQDRRTI